MKLRGSLKLRRQSNYYNDNLISLDFPRVANDKERDRIDSPSHGDLIITLDDHSLNIYDNSFDYWKKLKCNYSLDRAIFSSFSYSVDWFAVRGLSISSTGSYEDCNSLKNGRYAGTMLSNGSGDVGFNCAGYSRNNGVVYTYAGSTANVNVIEYTQISTTLSHDMFGELTVTTTRSSGTSNAELNNALLFGISTTTRYACKFNMKSKADADIGVTDSILTGTYSYGHYPCTLSNCTLNRAIFGGGAYSSYTQRYLYYVSISNVTSADLWGTLNERIYYGSAASNGEGNRGLINFGGTTFNVDGIDLSTLGDYSTFGTLIERIQHSEGVSNRTRNRAIFHCGCGGTAVGNTYGSKIQYMSIDTIGDAELFQELDSSSGECAACSNS